MAELPPNLDDGELWVSSDILPNGKKSDGEEEKFPSELTYMEELAQQLSSNALLHQQQTKTKTPTPTRTKITKLPTPKLQAEVKPFIQIGSFQPNQTVLSVNVVNNNVGYGHGGSVRGTGVVHSVYAKDQGGFRVEMTPGYHQPPAKSATTITQGNKNFVQARGGVYHKQQNQGRNNFLPFQANVGGFVKGTGVFIPRVEATTIEARKKQGVKNEENQCRMPVKKNAKNDVGKKEVVGLKAPADIVLPQEWTY